MSWRLWGGGKVARDRQAQSRAYHHFRRRRPRPPPSLHEAIQPRFGGRRAFHLASSVIRDRAPVLVYVSSLKKVPRTCRSGPKETHAQHCCAVPPFANAQSTFSWGDDVSMGPHLSTLVHRYGMAFIKIWRLGFGRDC